MLWIISEGSPGHVSQSRGVADALAALVPSQTRQIEVRKRGPGSLRGLCRSLFRLFPGWRFFWTKICTRSDVLPDGSPDIIIASGGKSVFYARFLADHFHVPFIFCGSPAPYRTDWFDCILSTEPAPEGCHNWISTDLLMNPITPEIVTAAASEYPLGEQAGVVNNFKVGAVLVGGYSRSHHFTEADWRALGSQLNLLSARDGWRWLISTSRRTGSEAEDILQSVLNPDYILDAVWWSKQPRKVVRAYLGCSQAVFVGRDSMTMVSESLCSGRPVVVFSPEETGPSQVINGFYQNLDKKKMIYSSTCQNLLPKFDCLVQMTPLSVSPVPKYAQQVLDVLARSSLYVKAENGGNL